MRAKVIACLVIVCFYLFLWVSVFIWAPTIIEDDPEWLNLIFYLILTLGYFGVLLYCAVKTIKWVIK